MSVSKNELVEICTEPQPGHSTESNVSIVRCCNILPNFTKLTTGDNTDKLKAQYSFRECSSRICNAIFQQCPGWQSLLIFLFTVVVVLLVSALHLFRYSVTVYAQRIDVIIYVFT